MAEGTRKCFKVVGLSLLTIFIWLFMHTVLDIGHPISQPIKIYAESMVVFNENSSFIFDRHGSQWIQDIIIVIKSEMPNQAEITINFHEWIGGEPLIVSLDRPTLNIKIIRSTEFKWVFVIDSVMEWSGSYRFSLFFNPSG